eukprot:9408593-Alexandrium_andersonii.AAC.1
MSASLVGSEMCIRDRVRASVARASAAAFRCRRTACQRSRRPRHAASANAVSYTHLTLPTICSV